MSMTLGEALAIAVLRGDHVAAYALADKLIEQRDEGADALAMAAKSLREETQIAHDGYSVYRWPEFEAFCKRAGILWDLRTISMTITIEEGGMLAVDHKYAGSNDQRQATTPIDTSTLHNDTFAAYLPPDQRDDS